MTVNTISDHAISDEFLPYANMLADVAGDIARRNFRGPVMRETKADQSPVTDIDRAIERRLIDLIGETFPTHGVFGEEFPPVRADADYVWVIDPIDGTKSFINGIPMFGVLIALLHQGVPCLGIIDHPIVGDRWVGARGHPTLHNGKAVTVRACASVSEASVQTSSPEYFRGRDQEALERMVDDSREMLYGTECMSYGLLASGFADIVIQAGMDPFDYLAAVPVVEGAGGRITDWQGNPLSLQSGDKVLACGDPALHATLLKTVHGYQSTAM